jgi:hypothetical protein
MAMAALAAGVLTACDKDDGSGDSTKDPTASSASSAAKALSLETRCEQLGKACGEKDKHKDAITKACKAAAKEQTEKGCADKATAAYDCYEKELCGKIKKIWALDDFRVLTERHNMCVEARKASEACVAGPDGEKK